MEINMGKVCAVRKPTPIKVIGVGMVADILIT